MPIATELKYAGLDELFLDPMNPRLGRNVAGQSLSQDDVLNSMRDWKLDELGISFLESGGFWTHEALLVVEELLYGKVCLVVVEGNRRLAALKYLRAAHEGNPTSPKWADIAENKAAPPNLFERIPYIEIDSRQDVEAFLGFRHVTGIKEWRPPEKAAYIARLIDDRNMDYRDVMRKIGSKTPAVRQHYISYRLLLQIEDSVEFPVQYVEDRFSVMYLSLRTVGVQTYLNIDIQASPEKARIPVPPERLNELADFALWLFGDEKRSPLFTDSRRVDEFGRILESDEAVKYLKRNDRPVFEVALRTAGGDEPEVIRLVERAADNIELALTRAHQYVESKKLQAAVNRFSADAKQLLSLFSEPRGD